ncbi:hypothetical protein KC332_g5391 [Hortaea werneckii]|uniref:Uncharacterized protein n=1 Tax=Hortaea werneckii EXF-2000 TaxID=1157616 RepID=A0A1Z5TUP7_HORWE|nr:hypothetical protein KC350_g13328 [Hortaea werneckii]OTA39698.1 hypothetical protein BTJ68_00327 [Hortaea werneckii EXF-2000]KAI6825253.1 hypothetical protein KC358_g8052 [Hortaea werneckii]KAI6939476.1 hypothetical protein KC341_g4156 [Hortaea werneckii]KAI6942224.1 hypothetical protein KC348_g4489 [Hortaea werneckii]
MAWVMSDAAQMYCGLFGLQRTASIVGIKAAYRRVRRVLQEQSSAARSQELVLAADLATLLLGQETSFEQDQCLGTIRTAGFDTRECVLQAALTRQPTRIPSFERPTLQAAELAASILEFIDGKCDWPEVLSVAEEACGQEIKRAYYNVLRCLKEDGYRKSDEVIFGLETMQATIKSQRNDVFPKEKYVSSNSAERRYDEEFVKLDEDDDRSNSADEYGSTGMMDASDEDDEEADTESMNAGDVDNDELASVESMDTGEDELEDEINDCEDYCGMDFMCPACSDCDDEEEMKAEKR